MARKGTWQEVACKALECIGTVGISELLRISCSKALLLLHKGSVVCAVCVGCLGCALGASASGAFGWLAGWFAGWLACSVLVVLVVLRAHRPRAPLVRLLVGLLVGLLAGLFVP